MLFSVDDRDPRPLYEQIVTEIKAAVADGRLSIGEILPGVRELADGLGVNLHTVHKAYQRLRDAGVIDLRIGRRARVATRGRPAGRRQVEKTIVRRVEELATDAAMLGVTRQEFSRIVERAAAGKLRGATS
jgi:DNA-binding transcriptional regulator YhcF (GntR family)